MHLNRLFQFVAMMAISCVAAVSHGQTLTLGTKLELTTLDPHFFASFPTGSAHEYVFERLTYLDENLKVQPSLAVSWRTIDELNWEFKLRPGVTFHDGTPLTAADVLFTLDRVPKVPNSPNPFTQFTKSIAQATRVDDLTLRFRTAIPAPMLPHDLAAVFIISAKHGTGATTADYNSGKAAIGTGPYKLKEFKVGDRLEVERFDGHWRANTPQRQPWTRVVERTIGKDPSRLAALLSGEVDVIDLVPVADIPRVKTDKRFTLFRGAAAQVQYIALDSARPISPSVTAKDGTPLKTNPLTDPRVRKALSLAINRAAIADRLMDGSVVPAAQLMPAQFSGTSQNLKPDGFDPSRAQALLKEAGWADGFRIVLATTNDRYPNDAAIAQTIAQGWTRIGLKAEVEGIPGAVFFGRASKQEFSAFTAQYGADDAGTGLRALVASWDTSRGFGTANRTRYSNAKVDDRLSAAQSTMDDAKRNALLAKTMELAMEETPLIPVFYPIFDFAAKKGLVVTPRPQRRFNALMVKPG